MKLLRCLPLVLILSFSVGITCSAAVRVEQLISDLAADSFSAREEATRLFLEQDPRVIPLVRNLLQTTDDAEVKQRARRILMVLEERDLDARLQAFLRDTDEKQGVSLPGWKQFRQVAGNSQAARDLFVEMQRCESKLLLLFDTTPDKVPDAMAQQMYEQTLAMTTTTGIRNARSTPKPGSVATYWFLAGEPELKVGGDTANGIVRLYHTAGVVNQLTSPGTMRDLFVRWILRESEPMVMMQNLNYATQLNLPEAGALAERVVTSSLQPSLRVAGLGMLVKSKKKASLPILEKALADEGITYQFFPNGNRGERPKEPYKIQFRDLALVQMMSLCEQKPADFGVTVPLPTESNNFNIEYQKLILATDEDRETLHKKWRAWWDDHKAEHLPAAANPVKS